MLAFYLSVLDEKVDKLNFEQICRKYDADVYRRIKSILRDEEDTREAMQETWLGVLQRMSVLRGKDEDSIKAYIMSIARNQGIAVLRKKQKESVLFSDIESEELIDDEDLFAICEDEGISRVMECINMLSESQREVITMHYLYHHSLKEIAELFGIPESIVESRWKNGYLPLYGGLSHFRHGRRRR